MHALFSLPQEVEILPVALGAYPPPAQQVYARHPTRERPRQGIIWRNEIDDADDDSDGEAIHD